MFSERIHKLLQPTPSIFTSWFWLPIPVNLPSGQQFAIENAIEIVDLNDLPIKNGGSFHSFLLVYQRVFQEALFWFSCGGAILKWICDFKCIGEPTQGKKKDAFLILPRSLMQHPIAAPSYSKTNCFANITILVFQTQIFQNSHDWHVWYCMIKIISSINPSWNTLDPHSLSLSHLNPTF